MLTPASRHPLHAAALGATMQATFGPRFVLGLGRGDTGIVKGTGLARGRRPTRSSTTSTSCGGCGAARPSPTTARWAASRGSRSPTCTRARTPQSGSARFGLPLGAKAAAKAFDGVLLPPIFTPGGDRRDRCSASAPACERDRPRPAEHPHRPVRDHRARSSTTWRPADRARPRASPTCRRPATATRSSGSTAGTPPCSTRIANHEQFRGMPTSSPTAASTAPSSLGPASLCPTSGCRSRARWARSPSASRSCAASATAGADEIVTYGSTPGQNARLAEAWVARGSRE